MWKVWNWFQPGASQAPAAPNLSNAPTQIQDVDDSDSESVYEEPQSPPPNRNSTPSSRPRDNLSVQEAAALKLDAQILTGRIKRTGRNMYDSEFWIDVAKDMSKFNYKRLNPIQNLARTVKDQVLLDINLAHRTLQASDIQRDNMKYNHANIGTFSRYYALCLRRFGFLNAANEELLRSDALLRDIERAQQRLGMDRYLDLSNSDTQGQEDSPQERSFRQTQRNPPSTPRSTRARQYVPSARRRLSFHDTATPVPEQRQFQRSTPVAHQGQSRQSTPLFTDQDSRRGGVQRDAHPSTETQDRRGQLQRDAYPSVRSQYNKRQDEMERSYQSRWNDTDNLMPQERNGQYLFDQPRSINTQSPERFEQAPMGAGMTFPRRDQPRNRRDRDHSQTRTNATSMGDLGGHFRQNTGKNLASGRPLFTRPNTADITDREQYRLMTEYRPTSLVDPRVEDAPPEFYLTYMPEPFNQVPCFERDRDYWKLLRNRQLKFDGDPAKYIKWRNLALAQIHLIKMPIIYKVGALVEALEEVPRLKYVIENLHYNVLGYLHLILTVEERFGGPESTVDASREKLEKLKPMRAHNVEDLEKFVDLARNYVETMTSYEQGQECCSRSFDRMIEDKLPQEYETFYETWLQSTQRPRNGLSMIDWCSIELSTKLKSRRAIRSFQEKKPAAVKHEPHKARGYAGAVGEEETDEETQADVYANPQSPPVNEKICPICSVEHWLSKCQKFIAMSPSERRQFILTSSRCYRCLRHGHAARNCQSKWLCQKCKRSHNTLLHGSREVHKKWEKLAAKKAQVNSASVTVEETDTEEEAHEESQAAACMAEESSETYKAELKKEVALRTVPAIVENEKGLKKKINILLDDGNTSTLISTRLASELKLTGYKSKLNVHGIGGIVTAYDSCLVQLTLLSIDGNFKTKISARVIPNPTGHHAPLDWNDHKKCWSHLKNIDFPKPAQGPVDIVVGNDYQSLLRSHQEVEGRNDQEPSARYTKLGWTVTGPVRPSSLLDGKNAVGEEIYHATAFMNRQDFEKQADAFSSWLQENCPGGTNVYFGEPDGANCPQFETEEQEPQEYLSQFLMEEKVNEDQDVIENNLEWLLRRTIEVEELPGDNDDAKELSQDEKDALEILKASRKKVGEKYQVSVLWKRNEPDLPNNYYMALNRLKSLEKSKYLATDEAKEIYLNVFRDWFEKGYFIKVAADKLRPRRAFYLPHFPVLREDKTTSKVRPVLDGKAKYNNKSLNDAVHSGPKLINDLCVVLLRFRARPVAIGGDVAEMFLQILMEEKDRPFHRILYREKPEDPVDEYEPQVHIFGNCGSPCVAIHVIKEHAKENANEFPRAAEAVIKSSIVDDIMDSVDTPEEATKLIQDLKKLFLGCGMKIRKFVSNHPDVLAAIPAEEKASNIDLSHVTTLTSDNMPLVKTLGVIWVAKSDQFTFAIDEPDVNTEWTMRKVLSCAHRLYDPLGFISPFMVKARLANQEHWRRKLKWDDPLPEDLVMEWKTWIKDLPDLPSIQVLRRLKSKTDRILKQELHTFVDASTKAYAAVTYVVTVYEDMTEVKFAMSRAKVGPLKPRTVPRLELMAAELGVQLAKQVNSALEIEAENLHFWSDSLNVLFWILSTNRGLKQFVANRVGKIRDSTIIDNWHWVPTEDNPADCASRGMGVKQLSENTLWWNAPSFLGKSREHWPEAPRLKKTPEVAEEIRAHLVDGNQNRKAVADLTKFDVEFHSSWRRAVRFISIPIFWLMKTKGQALHLTDTCVKQRTQAHIFRRAQGESFERTLQEIHDDGRVQLQNRLSPLQPALDEENVLRVQGRLKLATHLEPEARCPIMLPRDHHVTELLIRYEHEVQLKHAGGINHVLSNLNRKYWIPKGRVLVKRILRACVTCRNVLARAMPQQMAPLPDFRVTDADRRIAAFSTVGIDCAGPFFTKQGRMKAREKRYMLMFTCTQYRAVHIELLYNLTTESFLMAFSRFCAKRIRPRCVVSDNGRNFLGSDEELRRLWDRLHDDPELRAMFPTVEWRFNTPNCPHAGGVFERMIKSAKVAYSAIVRNADLGDEELETTFAIIEGIMNSRPISYVSDDHRDLEPLTPAHFLAGEPFRDLAPVPERMTFRSRWHHLQVLMDAFWERFIRECIQKLHKFPKWIQKRQNPEIGDVVIVLEEKYRGVWPLGRIEDVVETRDGLVRSVDVRVHGRTLRRDVQKVIVIVKTNGDQVGEDIPSNQNDNEANNDEPNADQMSLPDLEADQEVD